MTPAGAADEVGSAPGGAAAGPSASPGPAEAPVVIIVVPCYDEADRLDLAAFARHVADAPDTRFLFVDDGSRDATRSLLADACRAHPDAFELLALDDNRGKAEAVRQGILHAADAGPAFVGFWDADLATPLDELPRFRAVFETRPELEIVLGSRVNLLGRDVRRRPARHYFSRVFATGVSVSLRLPVYDTQCGAKLFRCTPAVVDLFREPFLSRWIFDAEILVRAAQPRAGTARRPLGELAHELPLMRYRDVAGSKVRPRHLVVAAGDALRVSRRQLALDIRRRRARGSGT